MKLLRARWWRARCRRAHLLFVAVLLGVYLATLVFFHVELEDSSSSAPRQTPVRAAAATEKTPVGWDRPQRPPAGQRKPARNGSTRGGATSTTRPLERCADVRSIQTAEDGDAGDRSFGSWPRRVSGRRPAINLAAPTLPWCAAAGRDGVDPGVNGSSSSRFRRLAGGHYVYSAYYDDREPTATGWGVLRVMSILKATSVPRVGLAEGDVPRVERAEGDVPRVGRAEGDGCPQGDVVDPQRSAVSGAVLPRRHAVGRLVRRVAADDDRLDVALLHGASALLRDV